MQPSAESGATHGPGRHAGDACVCVPAGSVTFTVNGHPFDLQAQDVLWVPAGALRSFASGARGAVFLAVHLPKGEARRGDETMDPLILDVREALKGGRRPMARILDAVGKLVPGQELLLRTTFEPIPLYAVLRLRGFRHDARHLGGDDWEVRFSRARRGQERLSRSANAVAGEPTPSVGEAPSESDRMPWQRLDNRGLEPPEPMMRTLEALNRVGPGQVLEIHNDRRPMLLYSHLTDRGYLYETLDDADGSAYVRVWRPSETAR